MIRLRGQEGYFSKELTLDGIKFQIRELEDDAYVAYIREAKEIMALSGISDLDPLAVTPQALLELQMRAELAITPELAGEILRKAWDAADAVLAAGLAGWTLPGFECTADNIVALPNRVKRALVNEILEETQPGAEDKDDPFSRSKPPRR
jgi:hypothetical protein